MPYTPPGSSNQSVLVLHPTSFPGPSTLFPLHAFPSMNEILPTTSVPTSTLPSPVPGTQKAPISLKLDLGRHANVIQTTSSIVNTSGTHQAGVSFNGPAHPNSQANTVSFPFASSQSHESTLSHGQTPFPPNAIRKKSGELVKPSLKSTSSFRSSSSFSAPSSPGAALSSLSSSQSIASSLSASSLSTITGVPVQTPSKMVHFDAQLEHVKLFKSEQKPAAVSRDGSPDLTTDTEGEESGVEYFGFRMPAIDGRRARSNTISVSGENASPHKWRKCKPKSGSGEEDEESIAKRVVLDPVNFSCPASLPQSATVKDCVGFGYGSRANVALSSLELRISTPVPPPLSSTSTIMTTELSLIGTILVRNLMFDKRVAVRFTFDDWQTVSEVGAKWIRSVEPSPHTLSSSLGPASSVSCFIGPSSLVRGHDFDLFEFSLKLSDHLLRIASKTLMFCIRFNVSGGEWWDNNHGSNYIANFGLKDIPIPPAPTSPPVQSSQGYRSITKGTFGLQKLDSSPEAEDLTARLDKLNASSDLGVEQEARRSTIPFPAPNAGGYEKTKDKDGKDGVRIKGPSKLPAGERDSAQTWGGSGGGVQMKLPQKRMENRRAFTFPNASVSAVMMANAAASAVRMGVTKEENKEKEDVFASFGPYAEGASGSASDATNVPAGRTRKESGVPSESPGLGLFNSTTFPVEAFMSAASNHRGSPRDWEHHQGGDLPLKKAPPLHTPSLGHEHGEIDGSKSEPGCAVRRRHHQRSSYFDGWMSTSGSNESQISEMERSNVRRTPPGTPTRRGSELGSPKCLKFHTEAEELLANSLTSSSTTMPFSFLTGEPQASPQNEEPSSFCSSNSAETVTLEAYIKNCEVEEQGEADGDATITLERLETESIFSGLATPSLDSNSSTTVSSPADEMSSSDDIVLHAPLGEILPEGEGQKAKHPKMHRLFGGAATLFPDSEDVTGEERRKQYSAFVDQFCFFTGFGKDKNHHAYHGSASQLVGLTPPNSPTPTASQPARFDLNTKSSDVSRSPSIHRSPPGALSPSRRTNSDSSVVGSFCNGGSLSPPFSQWTAVSPTMGEIITPRSMGMMASATPRS